MSVRGMKESFNRLMGLVAERLGQISKLEILMPVLCNSDRGNISRLEKFMGAINAVDIATVSAPRLALAVGQAERMAKLLFELRSRFLRSTQIRLRIEDMIKVIEEDRPLVARELRELLRDFSHIARWEQAPIEEVSETFVVLANQVLRNHREVAAERVAKTLKSAPPARKASKTKSARALNDAALRASMKGLSTGKPPKGTSNPKKAAKRLKKARARGESVTVAS